MSVINFSVVEDLSKHQKLAPLPDQCFKKVFVTAMY